MGGPLSGQVTLVTGGARRLGRAIALALAAAGAQVAIHARQPGAEAEATLAELRALGVAATLIPADLAEPGAPERLADAALAWGGRLDTLVCNAGVWGRTPVGEASYAQWDAMHQINLRAPFFLAQRCAPALRAARGSVIMIADIGAERPWGAHAPYLASKGGVVALTYALARDLAPEVRVNAIAPGAALMPDDASPAQIAAAARRTLLGRVGDGSEVGHAAAFLASAGYITGVVLPVDGGALLA